MEGSAEKLILHNTCPKNPKNSKGNSQFRDFSHVIFHKKNRKLILDFQNFFGQP